MGSKQMDINETHEKKLGKSENDKKYRKKKIVFQSNPVLP